MREATAPITAAGKALLRELLRLHKLFESANIPVIPYKGPLLAWVAYGSFIRREYSDLDFIVEQKFIPDDGRCAQIRGISPAVRREGAHAGQDASAPGQYCISVAPAKNFG